MSAPEITLSEGKQLAKLAASGDAYATRRLLERVGPRVVRSVQMVLGFSSPDIDDVSQHSLIALIQALPTFRGECEPEYFASRIAVRMAVAHRRLQRGRARHFDRDADTDTMASPSSSPERDIAERRRKTRIRALLDELPDEQAEALALRFMLGFSLEEVAESSGVPVNTVRSRVRLAKEALLKRLSLAPELLAELEIES